MPTHIQNLASSTLNAIMEIIDKYPLFFGLLSGISFVLLILTFLAIPFILVRLPEDYLVYRKRKALCRKSRHPAITLLLFSGKNLFGVCLIVLGLVMLITPGQGLLSILAGLAVSNVPGKYRLERWLITRRPVWHAVQYIRRRAGKPHLQAPRSC